MGTTYLRRNRRELMRRPGSALLASMGWARSGNHILVAAPPKSGSTLLTRLLCALSSKHEQAYFLPTTGDREQLIDESYIYQARHPVKWGVSQQHVRVSNHLREVCERHKIRPVVLQRNALDMLVSMRDHLNRPTHYPLPHFSLTYDHWSRMNERAKAEFLVHYMLPWYVDFSVGWFTAIHGGWNIQVVSYSDVTQGSAHLQTAVANLGINASRDSIRRTLETLGPRETNMNIGKPGRGEELQDLLPTARDEVTKLLELQPPALQGYLHTYLLG